jgi:hypothetical protein
VKTAHILRNGLILLLAVAGVQRAYADSVSYGGLSLSIDSREDLQDGTVKVVVRSTPFIIPAEGVERGVALYYLGDPDLAASITPSDLLLIISGALQSGDLEFAVKGILSAIRSRVMSPQAFGEFVAKVSAFPKGQVAIVEALRMAGQDLRDQVLCLCLPYTQGAELADLDLQLRRSTFASTCYNALSDEALASFRRGDLPGVKRMVQALSSLHLSDQQLIEDIKNTARIIAQASEAVGQGKYVEAAAALESLRKDPVVGSVAEVGVSALLVKLGDESLQKGDHVAALFFLTRVDFKQRTPQQHLMLSRALRAQPVSSLPMVLEKQTRDILLMYAGKDEALRGELIEYLERGFGEAIKGHGVETAKGIISLVTSIRSDPSEYNDRLRRALADELITLNLPEDARLVLQQIRVAHVPLSLRIWLLATGSLKGFLVVLLATVLALGALTFGARTAWRSYVRRSGCDKEIPAGRNDSTARSGDVSGTDNSSDESGSMRSFVFYPPEFRASGWRGEYEALLAFFGLSNDATLTEIKVAYRKFVKEAHPDRNLTAVADSSDQFIEISKKYERLIELYYKRDTKGSKSGVE